MKKRKRRYEKVLDKKRYDLIYMDPPWEWPTRNNPTHAEMWKLPYPTMSEEELIGMHRTVKRLMKPNCLVFMWVISSMIPHAIRVAESWNLRYKTIAFVWDKQRINPGNYTNPQVEVCLLFRRGRGPLPTRHSTKERQFISEMKREHSRKPDAVRHAIERMYPDAVKLEMFARETFEGWDPWGNETDKFNRPGLF